MNSSRLSSGQSPKMTRGTTRMRDLLSVRSQSIQLSVEFNHANIPLAKLGRNWKAILDVLLVESSH